MFYIAFFCLAIWVYLLFFRGGFWDVREPIVFSARRSHARIAAVIPARNEAEGIADTIQTLLRQDYGGSLTITLVDDHSADGTADIARRAAEDIGQSDRLTIIQGAPLPQGWTGKLWAVNQGVTAALAESPDFLLLTDADIEHAASNVTGLVARAETGRLDLVSIMVRLHCGTLAEKALIPAFVFFFFMLYPPAWVADPANRLGGAAGGCMLVRPAALSRIGGIASIRDALIDDCALAAAIKHSGGRISLDVSRDTHSTRIYKDASEIWSMIARTAFTQLRYSAFLLTGTLLGLFLTYLAPPLLAFFGSGWARTLGILVWLGMAFAFLPTLRLYRRSFLWGLALPGIAAFYAAATLGSAIRYWRGGGGEWKGRFQAIGPSRPVHKPVPLDAGTTQD